jgi:hypothetical protein
MLQFRDGRLGIGANLSKRAGKTCTGAQTHTCVAALPGGGGITLRYKPREQFIHGR